MRSEPPVRKRFLEEVDKMECSKSEMVAFGEKMRAQATLRKACK